MYILGINADHNSSCALLKDGEVITCVSEERFNRIKNYYGIPEKSIEYCLSYANIKVADLDLVVIASEVPPPLPQWGFQDPNKAIFYRILKSTHNFLTEQLEWRFPIFRKINETGYSIASFLLKPSIKKERVKRLRELIDIESNKFILVDHHLCHTFTALYGAPFLKQGVNEILIFTADAEGDGLATTVSVYKNGSLKRIAKTTQNNSLGNFYSAVTEFLGMKPGEHEYKVMGLAPYASKHDSEIVYELIKDWVVVDHQTLSFKTIVNSHQFLKLCQQKLKGKRFDLVAAAAQKLLEERMVELISVAIRKTGIKNIVASGGVFMNVKMNKLVAQLPEVKRFFVCPSCGDESNAFGTCFYGYKKINPDGIPEPIKDLYLGPLFNSACIDKLIGKLKNFKIYKPKNLAVEMAKLLAKGEIIARFAGRAEWGARALGNRSILADPSNFQVVEKINKMIKNRDFWMPFAPVILDEDKYKYLKYLNKSTGYYMMMAYDTKEEERTDMLAAIHPYDKTARAQVLVKEFNPLLWEIINNFKTLTGRGILLNTSFNIHGEPIVGTVEDALDVFKRSGLKFLALEKYIISKV